MKETKRIVVQRRDNRGFSAFLKQVQDAAVDGWLVDEDARGLKNAPTFAPYFSCWVNKGEEEVVTEDVVEPVEEAVVVPSPPPEEATAVSPTTDVVVEVITEDVIAEDTAPDISILDDKKSSTVDLKALADDLGIEIPEDKKAPAAIRKFLKEEVNK